MNLTEFLIQAVASFDCHHHLFNRPKCAALHVDSWRNPRYGHLATLLYPERAYQCHRCDLYRSHCRLLYQSDFKYHSQDACRGLYVVILAPLVPGYISYRTTSFFVSGQYRQAVTSVTLVVILAW